MPLSCTMDFDWPFQNWNCGLWLCVNHFLGLWSNCHHFVIYFDSSVAMITFVCCVVSSRRKLLVGIYDIELEALSKFCDVACIRSMIVLLFFFKWYRNASGTFWILFKTFILLFNYHSVLLRILLLNPT